MKELTKHIDESIVRYLTGEITLEEREALELWIERSEDNSAYFGQMQKVWTRSENLAAFRSVDVMRDFEQFKLRVGMQPKGVKLSLVRSVLKIAAVMIPAMLLVVAYGLYQTVPGFGKLEAFDTNETVDNILLPDASEVALNKNSKIVYERGLEGEARRLKLTGEAFFKVAKNPDKPFIVRVGEAEVKVLGTEFNIEENKVTGAITLSVTEGRVLFSTASNETEVIAGEEAVFKNNTVIKSKLTSENCIAWKTGDMVFDKASLREVLETVIDHFTEVNAVENNSSDTPLHITTRFTNPTLDDVLVELRIHFKKKFEINDNKLIISD